MHLKLLDDVGSNHAVEEEDTLNTKKALKSLGYYETPDYGMTGYPDTAMFDGIEKVQKDNGLFPDRSMRPGGETETAINRQLKNNTRASRSAFGSQQPGMENNQSAQFPNFQAPRKKDEFTRGDELRLEELKRREAKTRRELDRLRKKYTGSQNPNELDFYREQNTILIEQLSEIRREMSEIERLIKIRI